MFGFFQNFTLVAVINTPAELASYARFVGDRDSNGKPFNVGEFIAPLGY